MSEPYRILVIDDERPILELLCLQLQSQGYLVDTASDAQEALQRLSVMPDLILLDINMPGINGLDLCLSIREHVSCPILFVTANASPQDKIEGFASGGDDYITKPFSMEELFSRIAAHLRREERSHVKPRGRFFGELVIDYAGQSVFIKGEPVELSGKEFAVVKLLSRNPGQVFDRERMYELIWGYDGNGDSSVIKEHIRKIRMKFAEYTDTVYLETVWGVGYRWKK